MSNTGEEYNSPDVEMRDSGSGDDSDVVMGHASATSVALCSNEALKKIGELVKTPYLVVKRPPFTFEVRIRAWENQAIASQPQYEDARREMSDEEQLDVQGEEGEQQARQLEDFVNSEPFREYVKKMTSRSDRPTGKGSVQGMHLRHIIPASDICFVWYLCFTHRVGIDHAAQKSIQEKAKVLFGLILEDQRDINRIESLFAEQNSRRGTGNGTGKGLMFGRKNSDERKGLASLLAKLANSPLNLFLSDAAPNMAIGNRPDFGAEARAQAAALGKPDLTKLRDAWFELFTLLGLNPKRRVYWAQWSLPRERRAFLPTIKDALRPGGASSNEKPRRKKREWATPQVTTVYEHDGSRRFESWRKLKETCFVLDDDAR